MGKGSRSDEEENDHDGGTSSKREQRKRPSKGKSMPKRHRSDMTGLTGFNINTASNLKKGGAGGPELRGKLKRSNSGSFSVKSKESTFSRAKTVAGSSSSSTSKSTNKPSLEMLMNIQAEKDKSNVNNDGSIETASIKSKESKSSKSSKARRRGSASAIDKESRRSIRDRSLGRNEESSKRGGRKISRKLPISSSSSDKDKEKTDKKDRKKSSSSDRTGRSKSPGKNRERITRRPTSRSRSRGRNVKSSKSDNLQTILTSPGGRIKRATSGSSDMMSTRSERSSSKGSSKLAALKSSNHSNTSNQSNDIATLKKENQDLYQKKRLIQRQLEDERDKVETLELKVRDLQRALERGIKINTAGTTKTVDENTKELETKIASLETENSELSLKLKKERREQEQIIYMKDQEISELNESLEHFMKEQNGTGNTNSNVSADMKLHNELAQTKAQLRVSEDQLITLKEEYKNQELELKTLKSTRSSTIETITQADQDGVQLKRENEELQSKLKDKDETITHLMEQLKDLKLGASTSVGQASGTMPLGGGSSVGGSGVGGGGGNAAIGNFFISKFSPGALSNRKRIDQNTTKDAPPSPFS